MFQSLKRACTLSLSKQLLRCRTFDQDWCNVVCDSDGVPVSEGPYFFVKLLDTLFDHPDGLKGTGATVENTLLIDDCPYKNVRNNMWNAVHPSPFHSSTKPARTSGGALFIHFVHHVRQWVFFMGYLLPRSYFKAPYNYIISKNVLFYGTLSFLISPTSKEFWRCYVIYKEENRIH